MANYTFSTNVEGWTGGGDDGGGLCTTPVMVWDGSNGYPGLGCLRVDLCDMNGGPSNTAPFFDLGFFSKTAAGIIATGNNDFSFWYRIQNRKNASRTYLVSTNLGIGTSYSPISVQVIVPPLTTTPWTKFTATITTSGTINDLGVSIDPEDLATSSDGYSTYWIDGVFVYENDPTPPPPVGVTAFQPSTGGIPWSIKVDL